jgi:predicted nucleotide-binding protein
MDSDVKTDLMQIPVALDYSGKDVFIVHGHDLDLAQTTARFVEKIKLNPIILHEKPNKGRTIIEKFEQEGKDAGYAIILMTADDRGGTRDTPYESQSFRARQNVVLELGFFLGKLGRERVAVLYQSGVEIPSDYSGVVFIALDDQDAWKYKIGREMKSVGFKLSLDDI